MKSKKPNKAILKTFENRLQVLNEDDIYQLSKHDNGIFNVLKRFNKKAFGAYLWDDSKSDFDYYLTFVINNFDDFEGFILKLQPFLKTRNELTSYFASFICNKYKLDNYDKFFDTFQSLQRTLFEKMGFWTYDNSTKDLLQGQNGDLVFKGIKGIMYVPFSEQQTNFDNKTIRKKSVKDNKINYVYLMLNQHNGYYKIGRSSNVEYREKTLQAEEPDIKLIKKWVAPYSAETLLHRQYKAKRKRGEWFTLSDKDISEIKIIMDEIEKTTKKGKS